jgi:hypothetical protein
MRSKNSHITLAIVPLVAAALLLFASAALADSTICSTGSAASQCSSPHNIALDTTAKRLYLADTGNNRVDVFDAETGAFIKAFGYGVRTGAGELQVCETQCRAGLEGGAAGELARPNGIAVDNNPASPSFHDVYVGELGAASSHPRVQKFAPMSGLEEKGVEFLWMRGAGVNQTVPGNLCTAASGNTCGAAADSEAEGGFSKLGGFNPASEESMYVGVGPDSSLYVLDSPRPGGEQIPVKTRLQRFDESGAQIGVQHILFEGKNEVPAGLAVLPSGDLWASRGLGVARYDVSGTPLGATIPLTSGATIALGPSGNLFIGQGSESDANILEFEESGGSMVPRRRFGYGLLALEGSVHLFSGLVTPPSPGEEKIFVSEFDLNGMGVGRAFSLDFPPNGPGGDPRPIVFPEACKASPLGNSKGTLKAKINPEGKATGYHFEYVTDEKFQEDVEDLGPGHGFDHSTRLPAQASEDPVLTAKPGQPFPLFELEEAAIQTTALIPETGYHCRAVAENAEGSTTGQEGTFTSLPPLEIGSHWTSGVGTEEATLNAEVNPLGILTSAYFEYVDEATYEKDIAELGAGHGFDHALKAPDVDGAEEPIEFGAGEEFTVGEATIAGLKPGTQYRYRIVATDIAIEEEGKEVFGPTMSLHTYRAGEEGLPDGRAYELVSPAQKEGAEVGVPTVDGGLYLEDKVPRIQAAATSGEALTYTSWTSFGDPEGASGASQYLSRRTPTGWRTENISPFGFLRNVLEPPYYGFSADLSQAAFVVDQPALTEEAQEGFRNLYLRDNESGAIQALSIEEPQFTKKSAQGLEQFCVAYAGASADGRRAFFASNGAMAGAPEGIGFSLYEWSAAEGLKLVSVLPGEEAAAAKPAIATGFGAGNGLCWIAQHVIAHAVSEDGSKAFWTYGGKFGAAEKPLFARIDGSQTIELDAKAPGTPGPSGKGVFRAATADGSRAFFTAPGRLTSTAKAEGQLYLYDFEKPEGERLSDLTPGTVSPEILGVIGASEAGDYLYFVAAGVLTGEQEGPTGQKAVKGAANLYLWREGEAPRFIARGVSPSSFTSVPEVLSSRLTPDGHGLAFLAEGTQALSGYDNRIFPGAGCALIAAGRDDFQEPSPPQCTEAYLYDADADTLVCASCNPSGSRPHGPTTLPGWANPFEGPHYLSADGDKLFFESWDALSAADQNEKRDVYEFERAGSGSCDSANPAFVVASDGCLFLISTGRSDHNSYFVDASGSGRDAFFSTRSKLVGWDSNENYDVYDAREGGGFPEPPPIPEICEGEGCKPARAAPPAPVGSAGSAGFKGSGNQPPAKPRCPKGKRLTRGKAGKSRCVKAHKRHGHHKRRKDRR